MGKIFSFLEGGDLRYTKVRGSLSKRSPPIIRRYVPVAVGSCSAGTPSNCHRFDARTLSDLFAIFFFLKQETMVVD